MSHTIIGLTGGVASGKSEVARRFEALGAFVVDADMVARAVVDPGSPQLAAIVDAFGTTMLQVDGTLDRRALRERVFADGAARRRLEAILHPPIRLALQAACDAATGPYAMAAIPLLAEGGGRQAYPWLDRILVIDVPAPVQMQRLMQRDHVDAALADRMISAQTTRADRLRIADDILVNDGPLDALDTHVAALHARYRSLSSKGTSCRA